MQIGQGCSKTRMRQLIRIAKQLIEEKLILQFKVRNGSSIKLCFSNQSKDILELIVLTDGMMIATNSGCVIDLSSISIPMDSNNWPDTRSTVQMLINTNSCKALEVKKKPWTSS